MSVQITERKEWQPSEVNSQAEKAQSIALNVAIRFRERAIVEAAATYAMRQTAYPNVVAWRPYSVAQGYAGIAILCSYLDACFPDSDWDEVGHSYLTLAVQGAEAERDMHLGLYSGLSGLAFTAWTLSAGGRRYQRLLAGLDAALVPQIAPLTNALENSRYGVPVYQYDLISGLSGIGAYLLARRTTADVDDGLRAILRSLVAISATENGLPRWRTPDFLLADPIMAKDYPHGNLNCGLAHGIPGPLSLLALAYREGVRMAGHEEAIIRLSDWLLNNRYDDAYGPNWPIAVPLRRTEAGYESDIAQNAPNGVSRSAWCYGAPGVARSLWLAGEAVDRADYRTAARDAMSAIYNRPIPLRLIDSPTFCHGISGLLHITSRFAHDTGDPLFTDAARSLVGQLVALYEPDTLLGYRSLESSARRLDHPGLLDGVPGIVLALLAATSAATPLWDRLFLLA